MRKKLEESTEESELSPTAPRIRQFNINVNNYIIHVDEPLASPTGWRDEIALLLTAGELDTITFLINSPGGNVDTALAIIEGIRNSSATVQATIVCECSSAASLIALSCPTIKVLDSAYMMIHSVRFGTVGTVDNVKDQTNFVLDQATKTYHDAYAGFLTKAEINDVVKGKEIYLDSTQIKERLIKRNALKSKNKVAG